MTSFPTLRSWFGRPPRRAVDRRLRCEPLEDRATPALASVGQTLDNPPIRTDLPVSSTELVAQTNSPQPISDLANVVAALGLGNVVDLARSAVAIVSGNQSTLQVGLKPGASVPATIQVLAGTGLYSAVCPNYIYPTVSRTGEADLRERIPNDPQVGGQYHLPIVRAPQAWDKTIGSPNVVVAVLDDGLDLTHQDLKDNVWANPRETAGDGRDNDGNGFVDDVNGWDFVNNTNNVRPDDPGFDAHGTEIAGIIAGRIDNAVGVAGLAGRSRIMPLKVVGDGPTTSLTLARAVSYAVNNGARIINSSINVDGFVGDPTFQSALSYAYGRGILWINSAGNEGVSNPPRQAFEEMILVAATDRNDAKTSYSNYGSGIDLSAPGGMAGDGLLTTEPGDRYGASFGTSMSAAVASGTAALIWSAFPNWNRDQVASALIATADDIAAKNPEFLNLLGSGRLNAERAVSGGRFVTRLGPLSGLPEDGGTFEGTVAEFSLHLVSPLNPATVAPANFVLRWAGPDGEFATADDSLIPLTINGGRSYKIGTNTLDLTVSTDLQPGLYRFTAKAGGLTDPFGTPVDGDGNGAAGGDLVREFRLGYQVSGRVFDDTRDDGTGDDADPGLDGQTVYADLNGNGVFDQTTVSTGGPGEPVPDGGPATKFPFLVTGIGRLVGYASASVLVSHPRPSDLVLTLVSPRGTRVTLLQNRVVPAAGLGFPHLFTFAPGADDSTTDSVALASHRFNPADPLSAFAGEDANGTWELEVTDTRTGEAGAVLSASLTLGDEPAATTDASGRYALAGLPDGSVRVNVLASDGWRRSAAGGSVNVDLEAGRAARVDLGLVRPNAVYGRLLRDDGDGLFGSGDAGLAGATVYLDSNGNGVRDDGEPTAQTDASGNYVFPSLSYGGYTVRFEQPPGFARAAGSPLARAVYVASFAPVSTGNDFLLRRETTPVQTEVVAVAPAVRNSAVDAIPISLSEPIPGFGLDSLRLTRDGTDVPLGGATLIGSGTAFTLIGLSDLTAADGSYLLTVAPPAPPGEPGRQPAAVTTEWTTDVTPPAAAILPERVDELAAVDVVTVRFPEPVTGVTPDALRLRRNGQVVPLTAAQLQQVSANEFRLTGLAAATARPGLYTLEVVPGSGVRDAAGNEAAATTAEFRVGAVPGAAGGQRVAVGAGAGGPSMVAVIDPATGRQIRSFQAFEPGFTGGVRVSSADVTGDGIDDVIAVAGPGGAPRLRLFDGAAGEVLLDVMVFEPTFTGGLFVAAGDLAGDGRAEIVVTPDLGGGPRVAVLDGRTGARVADFFGIDDPAFRGGARAAVGDLDGDGRADLTVAAGAGGGPRVAVFGGKSVLAGAPARMVGDFFAFEPAVRNGVFVAAGDVDGDGRADLIVGGGPGGGPRVAVFGGQALADQTGPVPLANFFAGTLLSRGGVRVTARDADGDGLADIFTGSGDGQGSTVRLYYGKDVLAAANPPVGQFLTPLDNFPGGVYVG